MKYEQVWDAVDKLARAHGLSPSGLAKKAGLDATTFNKSKLGSEKEIRDNRLVTDGWKRMHFPDSSSNLYAIDIDVSDFEPFFKNGSAIIVAKNSEIRKNDRIVVILKNGDILIKEFVHRTPSTLVLCDLADSRKEMNVNLVDIELINRILWAGQ